MKRETAAFLLALALLTGLGVGLIDSTPAVARCDPPGGGTGSPKPPPYSPGGDGSEPSGR
jgi:hypothetical protein